MPNTALITGASVGIGREFARYHASKGGDLIIVARRAEALAALKAELEARGVKVHVIAADIGSGDAALALVHKIRALGLRIDILVNNAGFGGHGLHTERPLGDELAMIDLNVKALVVLTHEIGGDMVRQGAGRILNVSSTAGMMPGPLQATYFATKAFVSSFSQAVDEELREKGVTVTVLAPGPVKTEFFDKAKLNGTDLARDARSPESVARIGYEAMLAGKLHVINDGRLGFLLNWVVPLMPRRWPLKIARRMQTRR